MATKEKPKPKRGRKPKQGFLPGTEPEVIQEIEDAATIYHEAKSERVKLSKEEDEAKDNLIDKMKEHKQSIYQTVDGIVVTVTSQSNVKTKRKSEAADEEEDED